MTVEDDLIRLIETNIGADAAVRPGARVTFVRPAAPYVSMPMFVSQHEFRMWVLLAEERGYDPRHYLGPGPLLVHPDALAWYVGRMALGRMREHFGMLSS